MEKTKTEKKKIPKFKWKILFELKNTKIKDGKELFGKDLHIWQTGKNQVNGELFFDTDFSDERIPIIVEDKLNDFLNITALYHLKIGIDDTFILEKYEYKIANSMELTNAGIKVPTIGTLSTHTDVLLSKEFIDDYHKRIEILNASKHKHYIDNILRQYRIAYMQDDPFIRFEQLWITFMTLLSSVKPNPEWDDKKILRDFSSGESRTMNQKHVESIISILSKSAQDYDIMILGPHMQEEKCNNFLEFLIKLKIPIWQKETTYSEELELLLKKETDGKKISIYEKFMKIIFCLYGIRNQLFHCTKYSTSEFNIGRMRLACFILATVLRISINSYIVKNTALP